MLPVLGVKSLSSYAIAYLDRLLLLHANLSKGFGIMGPKEFFPLLDFAFMPKNSLSPRATPSCPDDMKRELLSSMTECLSVDVQSLGVWRQLYTKHLPQSSLLLNHLMKSWNVLPPKLQKNLEETIRSFRVTNEEMKDTVETEELQECNKMCQSLQVKMRGNSFPWLKLLVLSVFAAGFVAHDIRSNGSVAGSSTAKYLQSSGVTAVSQQAWSKVTVYSKQGFSWLEKNTPHYYSECVRVLGPIIRQAAEQSRAAGVLVSEKASQLLLWLRETAPLAIDWVNTNTPDGVFQLLAYIRELLLYIQQNVVLPAAAFVLELLQRAWSGLQDSCNGEVSVSCRTTPCPSPIQHGSCCSTPPPPSRRGLRSC
ncbi:Transmembrane protein 214-B [Oryzias melastigma]|uniref:Transmembrane protein 214-B n=1 Tax=Oryzias melastigma TaxID=30732 RepID=A0A834KYP6_ORYME|nr:Transmembrane protein 214-B [Oryzias melastigma]